MRMVVVLVVVAVVIRVGWGSTLCGHEFVGENNRSGTLFWFYRCSRFLGGGCFHGCVRVARLLLAVSLRSAAFVVDVVLRVVVSSTLP